MGNGISELLKSKNFLGWGGGGGGGMPPDPALSGSRLRHSMDVFNGAYPAKNVRYVPDSELKAIQNPYL